MRIAGILISTHACGTTMRRTNKARCESKADVAAVSCIRPSSGASFSCEFPPYWIVLPFVMNLHCTFCNDVTGMRLQWVTDFLTERVKYAFV